MGRDELYTILLLKIPRALHVLSDYISILIIFKSEDNSNEEL